jgi:protocatechuate 3,4-dioxygenase beta subunit
MKKNKIIFICLISIFISISGLAQYIKLQDNQLVGGPCEGCEAVFEYGNRRLKAVDTLPDYNGKGQKIKITGTIYQPDGKTPAEGVILYIYHTNQEGIYAANEEDTGWGKRHGHIRGWIKTGKDGKYTFFTLKPGRYPNRTIPAHIHPIILEPDGKYYWVGSYHFDGDPYLTEKEISPDFPRCGSSGLLILKKVGDIYIGIRDFILGKNISDY